MCMSLISHAIVLERMTLQQMFLVYVDRTCNLSTYYPVRKVQPQTVGYFEMLFQDQMGLRFLVRNDKKRKHVVPNNKRDRRFWTAEEETLLVDILYDMNNTGWKVDTGHKIGYLAFIEKELAKKLPNSNIRADPHIKSKVKVMKKHLSYILEIQKNGSDFGWDDEHKMVIGEKEIFIGWAKSREGAAQLWMKCMPRYDKLVKIYATDMAKGSNAKDLGDDSSRPVDVAVDLGEIDVSTQPVDESGFHSQPNTTQSSRQSVKRKAGEVDPIEQEFLQLSKSVSSYLESEKENTLAMTVIKNAWDHEVGVNEQNNQRRDNLFKVIHSLPEPLKAEHVVQATHLIGQDPTKLALFYGMPDEYKLIFIAQEIAHPLQL